MKKYLILLASLSLSIQCFAQQLKEGAYQGANVEGKVFTLIVKDIEGRTGSFLGLLLELDKKPSAFNKTPQPSLAIIYLIESLQSSSFSMTPLQVTGDGNFGFIDDDPSLVLNQSNKSKNIYFELTSSGSDNIYGFKGPIKFNKTNDDYKWVEFLSGNFILNTNDKETIQVSPLVTSDRESTASLTLSEINGLFTMFEHFPSIYLLNQMKVSSTGSEINSAAKKLLVFLNLNKKEVLMVVSLTFPDKVLVLERK